MSDPGLYFKNKSELIKWYQRQMLESYSEYLFVSKKVRVSDFPGAAKLFKNEKNSEVADFGTFLTELNIANHLLNKKVKGLEYKPRAGKGVDFRFADVALSVKNLSAAGIERGKSKRTAKVSSEANNYDSGQMSLPMRYLSEFEKASNGSMKNVLFILNDSQSFDRHHLLDIGNWYFGFPKGYNPIFANDLNRYAKLFGKAKKKGNIDAIIFMYPTDEMIWPPNSFAEMIANKHRMIMFCPDRDFKFYLLDVFS
jgi:hypothetical protein